VIFSVEFCSEEKYPIRASGARKTSPTKPVFFGQHFSNQIPSCSSHPLAKNAKINDNGICLPGSVGLRQHFTAKALSRRFYGSEKLGTFAATAQQHHLRHFRNRVMFREQKHFHNRVIIAVKSGFIARAGFAIKVTFAAR